MSFFNRYTKKEQRSYGEVAVPNVPVIVRDTVVGVSLLLGTIILWPFNTVPTGYRGVITQFGEIKGIVQEGLVIVPPHQKLNIFNVRAESVQVNNAEGATANTQPVHVGVAVRYSIRPDRVSEVFEKYSKDGDLNSYVQTAVLESFKAVTAKYTATELISKRQQVSNDVYAALNTKLGIYGAGVINVDMTQFKFSDSYMAAINESATQEQKRLAAENKLRTVESEQKQKVAIAEAEASATKATADGAAYATMAAAKATADALRIQNAALKENKDVLELRKIEVEQTKAARWNGELPLQNYFGSAPVPFFNTGVSK